MNKIRCTPEELKRRKEMSLVLKDRGYTNVKLEKLLKYHRGSICLWFTGKYNGQFINKRITEIYEKCLANPI